MAIVGMVMEESSRVSADININTSSSFVCVLEDWVSGELFARTDAVADDAVRSFDIKGGPKTSRV